MFQNISQQRNNFIDAETIAHGLDGKPHGNGFMACCPSHDDRSPSLSITDGDSSVLLHCFAGCDFTEITNALRGLGLWHQSSSRYKKNTYSRYSRKQIDYAQMIIRQAKREIDAGYSFNEADIEEILKAKMVLNDE